MWIAIGNIRSCLKNLMLYSGIELQGKDGRITDMSRDRDLRCWCEWGWAFVWEGNACSLLKNR